MTQRDHHSFSVFLYFILIREKLKKKKRAEWCIFTALADHRVAIFTDAFPHPEPSVRLLLGGGKSRVSVAKGDTRQQNVLLLERAGEACVLEFASRYCEGNDGTRKKKKPNAKRAHKGK